LRYLLYSIIYKINKARNKTKYPKIFRGTYWGTLDFEYNKNFITDEILSNRNKFVENYNVKRQQNITLKINKEFDKLKGYIDNTECYLTDDNKYILTSNPYNNNDTIYAEFGWYPTEKLYRTDTMTYMKIIDK
jgi:hypothetical protein